MSLIFVDCESTGPSPSTGRLDEFGAVEFKTRQTFHGHPSIVNRGDYVEEAEGVFFESPFLMWRSIFEQFDEWLKRFDPPLVFVSDNPAYDWQWINDGFHVHLGYNPMGHSARRIGDFYAGLVGDWRASSRWKTMRVTKHDHNPINDSMGNVEAFAEIVRRYNIKELAS